MEIVALIIKSCLAILSYQIDLFGFYVSLSSVMIFAIVGSLLGFFLGRLFK